MDLTYYMLMVYATAVVGNPCLNQILNTVPYPHNCNTFIVCWMSKPYFQACPIGSLFDTVTNNCQPWAIAICCHFPYPPLRRPLPPSSHRRILPPIPTSLTSGTSLDNTTNHPVTSRTLLTSGSSIVEGRMATTLFLTTTSLIYTEQSVKSTASIVTSTSDNNLINHEMSTVSGLPTEVTEGKPTVPPTILTSVTNGATPKTTEQPVKSTASIVTSTSDNNLIDHETSTAIGTPTGVTEGKPTILTWATNGATPKTTQQSVKSTASIVTNTSDNNLIDHETSTATGTQTEFTKRKPTVPPTILTWATNGATPKTTQQSVKSTASIVTSTSDNHLIDHETSTAIGTPTGVTEGKPTVPPTILTWATNGATPKTTEQSVKSTASIVTSTSDDNLIDHETSTASGLPTEVTERKPTVPTTILTWATNGATAKTTEQSVKSTASIVTSTSDNNLIDHETSTATGTQTEVTERKLTVPPTILTWATNGATPKTTQQSVKSTASIVTSTSDNNLIDHETSTAIGTPTGVTEGKPTVPPTILTSTTNGATPKTTEQSVKSTASIVTSTSDNNLIDHETSTATGTQTKVTERKLTVPPSILTWATNGATPKTTQQSVKSTASIVTSTSDNHLIDHEMSTAIGTPTGVTEGKPTVPPTILTWATNGATPKTTEQSVKSTASIVTSTSDNNLINHETSTASGLPTEVTERKPTVPTTILTWATNGATAKTTEQSVKSTASIVTSTSDNNLIDHETSTATGTQTEVTERKLTVPPTILTWATNGATPKTTQQSVKSTASIVTSTSDNNLIDHETSTAIGTPTGVTEGKPTVPPTILTSTTNGATPKTTEQSVKSTTSIVTSTSDNNLIDHETSTAIGTPTGVTEGKPTVLPTILTSTTNGATPKTTEQPVKSTTSIVTSTSDNNLIDHETSTAIGTPTGVTEGKPTVPPTILTWATNGATPKTTEQSVKSTASVVTSTSDNNLIDHGTSTASGLPTEVTEGKPTVPPTILTSATNGAIPKTTQQSVKSTAAIVTSTSDNNLIDHETSTASGLPTEVTERKPTVPTTILTWATNGATAKTTEQSVKSTASIVTSTSDNNLIDHETSTATGTQTEVTERKLTVPPTILTWATNGATPKTTQQSVKSTASIVTSTSDNHLIDHEMSTAISTPTGVTEGKPTVPPTILTWATNGATPKPTEQSVKSTASIVTSTSDNNLIDHETSTASGLPTEVTERKPTVPTTILTWATNGATAKTTEQSVKSTASIVTSTSDNNLIDHETSTASGLPTEVTERKPTVPTTILTWATNGATPKKTQQSVKSTASIVTSTSDNNLIDHETSTAIGTPTGVTEGKPTVPPTILTSTTNGATPKTTEQSVKSTTSIVTITSDNNLIDHETSTAIGTPTGVTEGKPTVPPTILTSTTNGATPKTTEQSVKSTASIVTSTSDNNLIDHGTSTASGLPTEVTEGKPTVPPTILTSATNGATPKTTQQSVKSTASIVTSTSDNNLIDHGTSTASGLPTEVTEGKPTVPPTILTSATNGATPKTTQQSVKSTASIVTSTSDNNLIDHETSTAIGTPTGVTEGKPTVPPTILTSTTNGATPKTTEQSVKSTASIVTSTSDNNLIDHETSTAIGTPTGVTEGKPTGPLTILTWATNGATPKTTEQSVKSTVSIVTSTSDNNLIDHETSTAIGTPTGVTEGKPTVPPTILTSTTNGATPKTTEQSVKSTASIVTSTSDNNLIDHGTSTASGLPTEVTEGKSTVPPTILTSATNGATPKTTQQSVKSTASIVTSTSDNNLIDHETSTAIGTPTGVTEGKPTVPPTILTSTTNGATPKTTEQSVKSTASVVTSTSDNNLIDHETSTAIGTPTGVTEGKPTGPLTILTSATNGATPKTTEQSVKSTVSIVTSTSDNNSIDHETSTASGLPTEVTEGKPTVPPTILISTTNGATPKTTEQSVKSTASIVTSTSDNNLIDHETSTASGLPTEVTERKPTVPPTILTWATNGATPKTTEQSVKSTASIVTSTSDNNLIDHETSTATGTPTGVTEGKLTVPPTILTWATNGATSKTTEQSVKSIASIVTSTSYNKEEKEEKNTFDTRPTLPPIPTIPNKPSPYKKLSTTSEAPLQPQVPDCDMNDNFVYPDLLNCNYYFKCFKGIMKKLKCRRRFGFHPLLMKCIPEKRAKCGFCKSAADQRSYLISFLLLNQVIKNVQSELTEENVET